MVGKKNFMDRKKCWIGLMTIYGKRYIKILHKNVHKFLKVQSISKFYSKIIGFRHHTISTISMTFKMAEAD